MSAGKHVQTTIWQRTLGRVFPENSRERVSVAKLAEAYDGMREKTIILAEAIPDYLKFYTVHDITHLDALWDVADTILSDRPEWVVKSMNKNTFTLNPLEAFVLGGAFLLHDLGMSLKTYPGGMDQIKALPEWRITLSALLAPLLGRAPDEDDLNSPKSVISAALERPRGVISVQRAFGRLLQYRPGVSELRDAENLMTEAICGHVLRIRHAQQAKSIATNGWTDQTTGTTVFWIEPPNLRLAIGEVIGDIAFSHHSSVADVEKEFKDRIEGAPGDPDLPQSWKIDTLKIAFLLRACDAAHLDARRAPHFRKMLVGPRGVSARHWAFQAKLRKPTASQGLLHYQTSSRFAPNEAGAWWLAYETLSMVDRELREVDAVLLKERSTQRLGTHGVAGVASPETLKQWLRTKDWEPVDARVHVANVQRLVRKLGGWKLYGNHPDVVLRELIQNAVDAVVARRLAEGRPRDWGLVTVEAGHHDDSRGRHSWIRVKDNGLGMTKRVLTEVLLDFGESYWNTSLSFAENPGLAGTGFSPTGKYGIGFFSVFMLGRRVTVHTRPAFATGGLVLEFKRGLSLPPILRSASEEEEKSLPDGGTTITVWLKSERKSVLALAESLESPESLGNLIGRLAPTARVEIHAQVEKTELVVCKANDWLTIQGAKLLDRISSNSFAVKTTKKSWITNLHSNRLTLLKNQDGQIVGRAGLYPYSSSGIITVGGMYSSDLKGVVGVLLGNSETLSRDKAILLAQPETLKKWASVQCRKIYKEGVASTQQMHIASYVSSCGAKPNGLIVAKFDGEYVTLEEIESMKWPSHVAIFDEDDEKIGKGIRRFSEAKCRVFTDPGIRSITQGWMGVVVRKEIPYWLKKSAPRQEYSRRLWGSLLYYVASSIVKSWGKSLEDVLSRGDSRVNYHSGEDPIGRDITMTVLELYK